MNTALALLLPVLAAFRIVNDPTVQDRLFGDCSWFCCQSWAVWTALVTLMMYCEAVFQFGYQRYGGALPDAPLPVLIAFGVVNNPMAKGTL